MAIAIAVRHRARRVNGSNIPAPVMESTTSAGVNTRVDASAPPLVYPID
jgi:hypothetical protein